MPEPLPADDDRTIVDLVVRVMIDEEGTLAPIDRIRLKSLSNDLKQVAAQYPDLEAKVLLA